MSKSRSDQDYDRGYNEGKKAGMMDRFTHGIKDIVPGPKRPGESSYDGGYTDGVKDQYDDNDSHYQGGRDSGSGSDGCFITTATLNSIGKSDNCEELNLFRGFRDQWLRSTIDGQLLITEYYNIAPKIVNAINLHPNSEEIYSTLWKNDIEPCLGLIKRQQFNEAKLVYKAVVVKLKNAYLNT